MIWPKEVTLVSRNQLNPRVHCAFGNVSSEDGWKTAHEEKEGQTAERVCENDFFWGVKKSFFGQKLSFGGDGWNRGLRRGENFSIGIHIRPVAITTHSLTTPQPQLTELLPPKCVAPIPVTGAILGPLYFRALRKTFYSVKLSPEKFGKVSTLV